MDTALYFALALQTADWMQTRQIAKDPAYYEYNPILGNHPSMGKVNRYFAAIEAGTVALNLTLPKEYAHGLNLASIGFETAVVGHNLHIGLRIKL